MMLFGCGAESQPEPSLESGLVPELGLLPCLGSGLLSCLDPGLGLVSGLRTGLGPGLFGAGAGAEWSCPAI